MNIGSRLRSRRLLGGQVLRRQLLLQLLAKPADFAPKRDVVDFGRARVLRPGLRLPSVDDVAGRILENFARDPNLRRVRDSDVAARAKSSVISGGRIGRK